jgi:hypothetical protein
MSYDRWTARRRLAGLTCIVLAFAAGCGTESAPSAEGAGAVAAVTFTSSPIVGVQSNRCVDVANVSTANGAQAQLWDCNRGTNQSWTYDAGRTLVVYGNKCLQPANNATAAGTALVIWDCTGQASQQWNVNSDGTVTNVQSGLCMDANGAATANGTRLILWSCSGASNQRWTVSGASTTTYALTVARSGTGGGTVTSTPAGIDCGAACSATYASGTTVTLAAAPGAGSTFAGWSGACTGTGACTVAMTAARTVTATFETTAVIDATVSVNAGGAATGSFAADGGFTGGSTYSTTTAIDTSLVPAPAPPAAVFQTERYGEFTYTFANRTPGSAQTVTLYFAESFWTAAGQRTFNVAINGATVLTAFDIHAAAGGTNRAVARTFATTANGSGQVVVQFTRAGGPDNPKVSGITVAGGGNVGTTYALTVTRTGTGSGTVAGGGISCGATCSATYASGTTVTLAATAASGSAFAGWSGACTGTGACIVSMTAARSVTATFNGGSAVGSAGCGKTSTLRFTAVPGESGSSVGFGAGGYVTIQSGGGTRGFALRLPDNYDPNKPYWLIFGFHWNGGTSKDVDTGGSNGYSMAHFGLQALSRNGAIFVAPQGLNNGWANTGGRDLTFVDDMVRLIQDNYCVDTKHVFTNGFSYGGGMSYAIACARAKVFRGAAIYEGAQLSGCEGGNDPIALWQMVGLEDNVTTMSMALPIRDRFVRNNGCTVQNPPQPPRAPPYLNPGGHVCTNYSGCTAGYPLRWCVHQSGHGNAVVDGTGDLYNTCATPPRTCSSSCPCTWVPEDVWRFFTAL